MIKSIELEIKENPTMKDALEANVAWHDAEKNTIGNLEDRCDLCSYSEWASRKALGQDVGLWVGLDRFELVLNHAEAS